MTPNRWGAALLLASVGVGCEPSSSDYVAQARQSFEPRSTTMCCDDKKCTDVEQSRCAFLQDSRIVGTTVTATQGPPGLLHKVTFEIDGPHGKGRCTFHYWNTGPRIQLDINVTGPTCVAMPGAE